nr:hypothetical protein KPHV_85280 [Kitasatospora purpeofusca]
MIPAGAGPQPMPRPAITSKYQVTANVTRRWVTDPTFPAPEPGTRRYRPELVDAWVRTHHPAVWAATKTDPNPLGLPEGDDEDLLTAREFGELLEFTRGRPIPQPTIRAYEARHKVPRADRRPDDGKSPTVRGPRWYRRTVYAYILEPHKLPAGSRPASPAGHPDTPTSTPDAESE